MHPTVKSGVATIVFSPSSAALGSDDDSDDGTHMQTSRLLPTPVETPRSASSTAPGSSSAGLLLSPGGLTEQKQPQCDGDGSSRTGLALAPPSTMPADSTVHRSTSELFDRILPVPSPVSRSSDVVELPHKALVASERSASKAVVFTSGASAGPTKDRIANGLKTEARFDIDSRDDADDDDVQDDDDIYGRSDDAGSDVRRQQLGRSSSGHNISALPGSDDADYDNVGNTDDYLVDADVELDPCRSRGDSGPQLRQQQLLHGRRADSSSNLLLIPDDEGSGDEPLALRENHFGNAEDFHSLADIERTIDRVKLSVLGMAVDNPQRPALVEQLVALRMRRDELREGWSASAAVAAVAVAPGDPKPGSSQDGSIKSIYGHTLCKYHAFPALGGSSERSCEACQAVIWGVLQSWYGCTACPVVCHERCLGSLRRPCGAFAASGSGSVTSTGGRSGGAQQRQSGSSPLASQSAVSHLPTTICPEVGLAAQSYRCFECRAPLAYCRTPELEPRQCDVTGRYYCSVCHWSDEAVSPARVLHNWDFEPRPVCRLTKHRLAAAWRRWLVRPRDINARLYNFVEELSVARRLREEILQMKAYFATCSRARHDRLLLKLADRQHFVDDAEAYTLRDLVDLAHDTLLPELVAVHAAFTHHIKVECEACRGKGFLCELCDNRKDVLFPFDGGLAAQCAVCQGVFHRVCFAKCNSPCPRCERRSRRAVGNGGQASAAIAAT